MCVLFQNRPTGECYVQMKSVDAARKASDTLHKNYMERRYIEVFQVGGCGCGGGVACGGGRGMVNVEGIYDVWWVGVVM